MAKLPKRPRDTAQLAKFIVEVATGARPGPALRVAFTKTA
jgi:hypothetical protein